MARHAFHAIGNTASGEMVLDVFPVTDDVSASFAEAYRDAEACCENTIAATRHNAQALRLCA